MAAAAATGDAGAAEGPQSTGWGSEGAAAAEAAGAGRGRLYVATAPAKWDGAGGGGGKRNWFGEYQALAGLLNGIFGPGEPTAATCEKLQGRPLQVVRFRSDAPGRHLVVEAPGQGLCLEAAAFAILRDALGWKAAPAVQFHGLRWRHHDFLVGLKYTQVANKPSLGLVLELSYAAPATPETAGPLVDGFLEQVQAWMEQGGLRLPFAPLGPANSLLSPMRHAELLIAVTKALKRGGA